MKTFIFKLQTMKLLHFSENVFLLSGDLSFHVIFRDILNKRSDPRAFVSDIARNHAKVQKFPDRIWN